MTHSYMNLTPARRSTAAKARVVGQPTFNLVRTKLLGDDGVQNDGDNLAASLVPSTLVFFSWRFHDNRAFCIRIVSAVLSEICIVDGAHRRTEDQWVS